MEPVSSQSSRPYFLWDVEVSHDELLAHLHDPDPDIRAQWQGRVLREARFNDVWQYVTLQELLRDWPRIRRHLGRSRELWDFLLDGWRNLGLLEGQ